MKFFTIRASYLIGYNHRTTAHVTVIEKQRNAWIYFKSYDCEFIAALKAKA